MSEKPDRALVWEWMVHVWRESPLALAVICVLSLGNAALVVTFPWLWQYICLLYTSPSPRD